LRHGVEKNNVNLLNVSQKFIVNTAINGGFRASLSQVQLKVTCQPCAMCSEAIVS